ncbi:unnamed protein product, partial [Ascophyllum nodosum]
EDDATASFRGASSTSAARASNRAVGNRSSTARCVPKTVSKCNDKDMSKDSPARSIRNDSTSESEASEDSQPASGVQGCSVRVATTSKEEAADSGRAPAARTDKFQSLRHVVLKEGDATGSRPLLARHPFKCLPKPGDGSSVVGASARVASRHRAIESPPIADTSLTAAYPIKGKNGCAPFRRGFSPTAFDRRIRSAASLAEILRSSLVAPVGAHLPLRLDSVRLSAS